jgi:hypothetical protein
VTVRLKLGLYDITGLFGDALKALEADGIKVDDRSARLILDRFCDLYKAAEKGTGTDRRVGRRASKSRRPDNTKAPTSYR